MVGHRFGDDGNTGRFQAKRGDRSFSIDHGAEDEPQLRCGHAGRWHHWPRFGRRTPRRCNDVDRDHQHVLLAKAECSGDAVYAPATLLQAHDHRVLRDPPLRRPATVPGQLEPTGGGVVGHLGQRFRRSPATASRRPDRDDSSLQPATVSANGGDTANGTLVDTELSTVALRRPPARPPRPAIGAHAAWPLDLPRRHVYGSATGTNSTTSASQPRCRTRHDHPTQSSATRSRRPTRCRDRRRGRRDRLGHVLLLRPEPGSDRRLPSSSAFVGSQTLDTNGQATSPARAGWRPSACCWRAVYSGGRDL